MILVDKDIKQRSSELFAEGYRERSVNAISYDLSLEGILSGTSGDLTPEYKLHPNETVFIRTQEKLTMPLDLMGRIAEKNSRMRQGLNVSGPHYFPGHETYLFLRVQNITGNVIKLEKGDRIAQIIFEQLTQEPEVPYSQQKNASYNHEDVFVGFGNYKDEYERKTEKLISAKENLEEKEGRIYGNILTLMGIFVSVFSLIMVNFSGIKDNGFSKGYLIAMNLSLGIVITMFMGLILIFLNKSKNKWFLLGYLLLFALLVFLFCFVL